MDNELLCVCAADNGFTVKVLGREQDEPAPEKRSNVISVNTPETYVFKTLEEVTKFISEKLPTLVPYDADEEFTKSFMEATRND